MHLALNTCHLSNSDFPAVFGPATDYCSPGPVFDDKIQQFSFLAHPIHFHVDQIDLSISQAGTSLSQVKKIVPPYFLVEKQINVMVWVGSCRLEFFLEYDFAVHTQPSDRCGRAKTWWAQVGLELGRKIPMSSGPKICAHNHPMV